MARQSSRFAFRYRLNTLLAVIMLVAIGLAGFKAYVKPFRVQRHAARRLTATGGTIEYRTADAPLLVALFGEKHFQHVVAVNLEHRTFEAKDLAPLADLPYLERLYLAKTPLTDEGLRHVGRLQQLRRVSLWETRITDEGIAHLADLTKLEVLDIHHTRLTEAALEHFRGHTHLVRLIHSIPVSDAGLAVLASMPRLRVESLTCKGISDKGLQQAARLRSLEWLRVDSRHVTDAGLSALNQLNHLTRVELRNCAATDDGIRHLVMAPALNTLRIEHLPISGECLKVLAVRPQLVELELCQTKIRFGQIACYFGDSATWLQIAADRMHQSGDSRSIRFTGPIGPGDIDHLEYYENVEKLILSGSPFDLTRAGCLERLPNLRSLEVNVNCDDDAAELLGRLTQLRELSLAGRQSISPVGYRHLARLTGLKVLQMRSCGLTDAHLAFLSEMEDLEILEIPGNRVASAGIDHLHRLSKLRRLNVSFCPEIDDEALAKISRLEHLQDLSAQDTRVTDAGLIYLFDMRYLRDVTVLGSPATQNGLRALRGALLTKGGTIY